jgi:phenylalanyl-tRNA synthetase alpha chain
MRDKLNALQNDAEKAALSAADNATKTAEKYAEEMRSAASGKQGQIDPVERLKRTLEQIDAEQTAIEAVRVKYLGKKGELSTILGGMRSLSADERRSVGEAANAVKARIEEKLADAERRIKEARLESELQGPGLDVTLMGRRQPLGTRHPVSRTLDDIVGIFQRMGYEVAQGPEIEHDYYNFEALNFPKDHPARDMQDTLVIDERTLTSGAPPGSVLLRTHTSPVQVRTMLKQKPPVRVICPGKVYRHDNDQTHTPMFHQVEGLLVDTKVTLADLKGTLLTFAKAFFGGEPKIRLRPSFFPFTEPSAEVDVSCFACGGKGCRICKTTGWLEVLGSGMVHPNVLKAAGYDPEQLTGFAFGMGVERLAMLRYGIDDLRILFENDVRLLAQF